MYRDVIIIGAGGFAREVQWMIDSTHQRQAVVGFLSDDTTQHGKIINGAIVLGSIEQAAEMIKASRWEVVCGIGSPELKRYLVNRSREVGIPFAPYYADPSVRIDRSSSNVDGGTVICANSSITSNVSIGRHVNINLNCTVGHDSVIDDYCNLSPGVHISGHVHLEEGVDLGTGAVVLPGIRIGREARVGAGAVVTKNVAANTTVVGVPAKSVT